MTKALDGKRSYTVTASSTGDVGGRYTASDGPARAARKAGKSLFRKHPRFNYVYVEVTETTQGSKKATHHYKVDKVPKSGAQRMFGSFTPMFEYSETKISEDEFQRVRK
jgi:hypothetical protein